MKILITGATGIIGRRVCRSLINEGHQVVVLSRRPPAATDLAGVIAFRWEPVAEPPPAAVWEGVEAVIHLAGEPVAAARWTDEQKRRIRDSRVKASRSPVDGMRATPRPPEVLLFCVAVGVY